MVERVNGLIKSATVGKFSYGSVKEMTQELEKYMYYYNTTRRHGSLQRELGVKTPVEAVKRWANLNENIFFG